MSAFQDMTGRTFCRLNVLSRAKNRNGRTAWLCLCSCGNMKIISGDTLIRKHTMSCGCLNKHLSAIRFITHGHTKLGNRTKAYNVWAGMIQRCTNTKKPNYSRYGGRNIAVCERWLHSFENFYADMGDPPTPQHSIDRIDNDGNYEPGNCRWATQKMQCRNRHGNKILSHDGRDLCVADWVDIIGINKNTLFQRLYCGWSIKRALTTPAKKRTSNK